MTGAEVIAADGDLRASSARRWRKTVNHRRSQTTGGQRNQKDGQSKHRLQGTGEPGKRGQAFHLISIVLRVFCAVQFHFPGRIASTPKGAAALRRMGTAPTTAFAEPDCTKVWPAAKAGIPCCVYRCETTIVWSASRLNTVRSSPPLPPERVRSSKGTRSPLPNGATPFKVSISCQVSS